MAGSLLDNFRLIAQMTRRDVAGRYRGSFFGLAWSFFNPVLMLVVYTFIFSVVFKARWGVEQEGGQANFAILLFTGMIMHGFFSECIVRAPGLIPANVNYVKKVVFPLDALPWVSLGSAMFHALISLVVLVLAQIALTQSLPVTAIGLPLILVPLILFSIGLSWLLASLGVYIRDVAQITTVATMVLMFLSPVFYPLSAVPERFHPFMRLNPLTTIIEEARKMLVFGQWPNLLAIALTTVASLLVAYAGFWWFQRTRKGFADVL